jgi:hypothetical protein
VSQEYCVPLKPHPLAIPIIKNYSICFACKRSILQACHHPSFVGHSHSHSSLLGALAEANKYADKLASPFCLLGHVNHCASGSAVTQAVQSHALYYQNQMPFANNSILTREQAQQIDKTCQICAQHLPFH